MSDRLDVAELIRRRPDDMWIFDFEVMEEMVAIFPPATEPYWKAHLSMLLLFYRMPITARRQLMGRKYDETFRIVLINPSLRADLKDRAIAAGLARKE